MPIKYDTIEDGQTKKSHFLSSINNIVQIVLCQHLFSLSAFTVSISVDMTWTPMGLSAQPTLDNFNLPEELVTIKYACDNGELLEAVCASDVENQTESCPLQSYSYSDRPHVLEIKWQGILRVTATDDHGNTATCGKDIPPYPGKINQCYIYTKMH